MCYADREEGINKWIISTLDKNVSIEIKERIKKDQNSVWKAKFEEKNNIFYEPVHFNEYYVYRFVISSLACLLLVWKISVAKKKYLILTPVNLNTLWIYF